MSEEKQGPLPLERKAGAWLELPELSANPPPASLMMQAEWLQAFGPLRCAICGRPIEPGEAFRLAGRCAMGGVVDAARLAIYADLLEPFAEHAGCTHIGEGDDAATG